MKGFNQVVLLGRLGGDPEVKHLQGDKIVARFSLATSKVWKDRDGQKHDKTEWHRIVIWGRLAEVCEKYLKKGSIVLIVGEINNKSWEVDGVKKYSTEINAKEIQFINTTPRQSQNDTDSRDDDSSDFEPSFNADDEIPF